MFKLLSHTADMAVEVKTSNLNKLFEEAGLATMSVNADLKTVGESLCIPIKLENQDLEKLLFDFLDEIISIKDVQHAILSKFELKIEDGKLTGHACGEKINNKMRMGVDVKAPTYHDFSLKKEGKKWKARFILDI